MLGITLHKIFTPAEAEQLAPLLAATFGPRRNLTKQLERWSGDPAVSILVARSAALGVSEIAGIAVAHWCDHGEWCDGLPLERDTLAPYLERRIGTFQLLSVTPDFRRQGVGRILCAAHYEWMKREGCRGAVGFAWQHGGADSSLPLFQSAGFELLAELPNFYQLESRESGHVCPVCRTACQCPALLFGTLW